MKTIALLCTSLVFLPLSPSLPARADDAADADIQFERGKSLYAQGQYEKSIEAFRASYRLVANGGVALNIAIASEFLARAVQAGRKSKIPGISARPDVLFAEAFNWTQTGLGFKDLAPKDRELAADLANRLKRKVAVLAISSDPAGAEIYIDRETLGSRGVAPRSVAVWSNRLDTAQLFVVIGTRAGFKSARAAVVARPGQTADVALKLEPIAGEVLVESVPTGARIRDDGGTELGVSPLRLRLPIGNRGLVAALTGFNDQTKNVHIAETGENRVLFTLVGSPATVSTLSVTGHPVGASIAFNGTRVGTVPMSLPNLTPGRSRIEVVSAGQQSWLGDISLEPGAATRLHVGLAPAVKRPWAGWKWLGYGGGGTLLTSGLIVGAFARSARSAFYEAPSATGKKDVDQLNLTADSLVFSGLLTLGISAGIHLLTPAPPASSATITYDR